MRHGKYNINNSPITCNIIWAEKGYVPWTKSSILTASKQSAVQPVTLRDRPITPVIQLLFKLLCRISNLSVPFVIDEIRDKHDKCKKWCMFDPPAHNQSRICYKLRLCDWLHCPSAVTPHEYWVYIAIGPLWKKRNGLLYSNALNIVKSNVDPQQGFVILNMRQCYKLNERF